MSVQVCSCGIGSPAPADARSSARDLESLRVSLSPGQVVASLPYDVAMPRLDRYPLLELRPGARAPRERGLVLRI